MVSESTTASPKQPTSSASERDQHRDEQAAELADGVEREAQPDLQADQREGQLAQHGRDGELDARRA